MINFKADRILHKKLSSDDENDSGGTGVEMKLQSLLPTKNKTGDLMC